MLIMVIKKVRLYPRDWCENLSSSLQMLGVHLNSQGSSGKWKMGFTLDFGIVPLNPRLGIPIEKLL